MNVCVCSGCSKKILATKGYDNKCFMCGTIHKIEDDDNGTYLEMVIKECEKELLSQNYSRAMELYDKYIELFPNISTLYWGRFMVANSCCNVEQLLKHGVSFEDNPDFQVACHFANDDEKECYKYLSRTRNEIANRLIGELEVMKKSSIKNTGIVNLQRETLQELNELREELSTKVDGLDFSEKNLRDKTADCSVQINSGKKIVDSSVEKIKKCKSQIMGKTECEDEEFHRLIVEMQRSSVVCDSICEKISHLNATSLFLDRDDCKDKQKTMEKSVVKVINDIESVDARMEKLLAEVAQIIKRYKSAISLAEKNSFSEAASLLGSKADDIISGIIRS